MCVCLCVCVLRQRCECAWGDRAVCVSGVTVCVWRESQGCDSGGRLGGVCVEAEMGVCVCVCVCVWRDCSEPVGVCGHSGVWVQVETGVCV